MGWIFLFKLKNNFARRNIHFFYSLLGTLVRFIPSPLFTQVEVSAEIYPLEEDPAEGGFRLP